MTPPTPAATTPRTTRPTRPVRLTRSAPTGGGAAPVARWLLIAFAGLVALLLQTTVFPHVAWRGVGPDVVLLVVVAVGIARGPQAGLIAGFAAGVLVDLAPPSDHVAGRWALALLLVGYVAGRIRHDDTTATGTVGGAGPSREAERLGLPGIAVLVAACSFLGTSAFALSGLLLAGLGSVPTPGVPELLPVVLAGVTWDVVVGLLVVPLVLGLLRRLDQRSTA